MKLSRLIFPFTSIGILFILTSCMPVMGTEYRSYNHPTYGWGSYPFFGGRPFNPWGDFLGIRTHRHRSYPAIIHSVPRHKPPPMHGHKHIGI